MLLSPAGARVVTCPGAGALSRASYVAVPRRGASCYRIHCCWRRTRYRVAVPRRGASCYVETAKIYEKNISRCCPPQGRELLLMLLSYHEQGGRLLSPAGARSVTQSNPQQVQCSTVAVPHRGTSCYGKNAKNTMRIFGIPTIFLYYLLYFCVSIRDIVGFLWCEPACNNLIYCYYNTRFAPNQPVSKPSSFATGCKTQRHKL